MTKILGFFSKSALLTHTSDWFKLRNCWCVFKWSRPEMLPHPFLFMSAVWMMRWHQTNDVGGLAAQRCSLFHLGTNFTDGEIVLHRNLWDVTYWGQATVETGDGKWSAASILRNCRIISKPMVEYLNDSDSLVKARQVETHLPQFHFFGILFKKNVLVFDKNPSYNAIQCFLEYFLWLTLKVFNLR